MNHSELQDVTPSALVPQERFYQTLLENAFDGIAIITFDGSIKFSSAPVKKILGYEDDSKCPGNILGQLHPDDEAIFKESLENLVTNNTAHGAVTVRFKHSNNSWRYIACRLKNLCDDPAINGIVISFRDITDKQLLRKNLEDSETRYRSLIENSFDGITIIDFDGVVKYHSPSLLSILGYRPASGIGKSILNLLHPDDHRVFYSSLPMLKGNPGKLVTNIVRFKHKNASWVILETRLVNFEQTPGIEGILINYRDITHSEHLKRELHENAERFKTIVETAPEAIFLIDTSTGAILDFNKQAMEMFGYPREEMAKMKGIQLSPRAQPDGTPSLTFINEKIQEALKGKHTGYEWHHVDRYGRLFPCEVRVTHFPPYDKKIIRGTIVDISKRRQIESSLKESEERYRNFTESAPETIFIVDATSGRIVDCNENATKLFGYSREKLLRMNAIELSPSFQPDGRESLESAKEKLRLALKGSNMVYEWYHITAKGKIIPTETRLVRFPPYDKKYIRGTVNDISARKALEEKLKQQEKEYQHLASVSPVGIFRTDTKGKTVYVNEKWCEITGLSFEEATGTGWQNAIHPDDRKKSIRDWRNAFKRQDVSNAVFRFQTPEGKTNWVYGQAVPDKDEQGNLIGYVGSVTDITDRMQAIEALANSEKRNSVLLKAIPDMIFRLSKTGVFLDFKAATNFGPMVPPELFLGKKIKNVLPPAVAQLCMKYMKLALRTNTTQTYNYSLSDQSNPDKLNYFEARIVSSDKNEALALIRDITLQKEAELSLKASEERWKSLVKSAPLYVVTINGKNQITFVNNMRGLKPKQVIGVSVFDFVNFFSVDEPLVKKALSDARKGKFRAIEISLKDRKGSDIWFNVISAPIKYNGKVEDLIVMALDITELKEAERELRNTNDKLKALYQRLETIREEEKKHIAMEIHDELGQELTAMKLGMFWMQQYIEQHRKGNIDIARIEDKVKSLIELSGQTISSARKLAHQLRPVVLDTLGLIPAIEWQIKTVNESGSVKCTFTQNVSEVKFFDNFSVALFRIVQESLTNILRHSGAKKAAVKLHVTGSKLALTIQDNGKGIKKADLTHPDRFGIFGMRERVKTWNGNFDLKTKRGKGTSLYLTFPLKEVVEKNGKHRAV